MAIDRALRAAGDVEASAEGVDVKTPSFQVRGRLSTKVRFHDADPETRSLVLDPSVVLASAGTIPGFTSALFPMDELTASGDLRLSREKLDLDLRARGSSATITARLHDIGKTMSGAVKVETQLASVGVAFEAGQGHVKILAGEDWLNARIAEVKEKESADRAEAPAAAKP